MAAPTIHEYKMLEIIGTGSYSVVHHAKHKDINCVADWVQETNRSYAVKCVAKVNLSKTSTDNLIREIKLLKTLKHKHIVEMVDFMWDEKYIYIIMELCDAGNLSTYIKRHGMLLENTCKFFIKQLASAMKYMRSNNISHFDLKPQNLLLVKSPTMTLKVADFGFAQYLNSNEENTVIKGSPLYMAPEILLKHSYNPSADLWSVGVILYECIYGAAPYSSKTLDELLHKIKVKQKIIIDTTKVSSECRDLMIRLLRHEPHERITFEEFFVHPFLNSKHNLSDENLTKAIQIVTLAVEEDEKKNYVKAYHLYIESLQYFIPLISGESDPNKRLHLQQRATTYMERAEEIKRSINQTLRQQQQQQQRLSQNNTRTENMETTSSKTATENNASEAPSYSGQQLCALFASMPSIQDALENGQKGELYLYEQNTMAALGCFTSALKVLVPILPQEPNGKRKEMLQKQVMHWMQEAESIKTLAAAHKMTDNKTPNNCRIQ